VELNKIYNEDCLQGMKRIPDKSVDLILTDIPYNISKENNFKTMKDRKGRNGIDFGKWDKGFDVRPLCILQGKMKSGGSLVLFHAIEQFSLIKNTFNEILYKDSIVWEKTNPMPRNRDRRYVSNVEIASWYVNPNAKWTFNRQSNSYDSCVYKYPSESGGGFTRYHPCQKNLQLIQSIILRHSNAGDTVLDPFIGGGTTAISCMNTGRNFIGFELSKEYCDLANKRIEKHKQQITAT
jgi:site-specific DNA-methyltransferase (adenine-specific)